MTLTASQTPTPLKRGGQRIYPLPAREELEKLYWGQGHSLRQIGAHYGVSISVAHGWMKTHDLPRRTSTRSKIRMIKGIEHKWCRGLSHPPRWVPVSGFMKGTNGLARYICKACEYFHNGVEIQVEFTHSYRMWVESIVRRLGVSESARRLNVSIPTLDKWRKKPPPTIRRRNARRIVALLAELRVSGETRHRKSIRYGAKQRGKPEREVVRQNDLAIPTGDLDVQTRKARRRSNPEHENQLSRDRRLRKREAKQAEQAQQAQQAQLTESEVA